MQSTQNLFFLVGEPGNQTLSDRLTIGEGFFQTFQEILAGNLSNVLCLYLINDLGCYLFFFFPQDLQICCKIFLFSLLSLFFASFSRDISYLRQTRTATAARTWQNKRYNRRNDGSARAFWDVVHFLAVCKTST